MTNVRWLAAAAASVILSGCSGGWWPFGGSSGEQTPRLPDGAIEYSCAQDKRLLVRYAADGKSAWIIFPDREFRLDRVGSSERYTNGASTLAAREDAVTLDAEGGSQFADCRAAKR